MLSFKREQSSLTTPMLPSKYPFQKTVRIYTMVMAFISKTRKNRRLLGALLREGELTFSVFICQLPGMSEAVPSLRLVERQVMTSDQSTAKSASNPLVSLLVANVDTNYKNTFNEIQVDRMLQPLNTDKYINMALKFLYRKGTAEVKEFNSAEVSKGVCYKEEIFYFLSGQFNISTVVEF